MKLNSKRIPLLGILFFFLIIAACSSKPEPTLKTLSISSAGQKVAINTQLQLHAIGLFSDEKSRNISTKVSWSVSDASLVTMDRGVVTGTAAGEVTVTASYKGQSTNFTLTVVDTQLSTVRVEPENLKLPKGYSQTYRAIALFADGSKQDVSPFINWQTTNTSIIGIDARFGEVEALETGTTAVVAEYNGEIYSTLLEVTSAKVETLSIDSPVASLPNGHKVQLSATGVFSDGSKRDVSNQVSWTSNDTNILKVDSQGLVSAVGTGSTTVTGTLDSISTSTPLTVNIAVLEKLSIEPASLNIPAGFKQQFSAIGIYSDGSQLDLTRQAIWLTDTPEVASINSLIDTGSLFALRQGNAVISATYKDFSTDVSVTVSAATLTSINVDPLTSSIAKGTSIHLSATGVYSDGSNRDVSQEVTWASLLASVATVGNSGAENGRVSSVAKGTTIITASLGEISGLAAVTVTDAELSSLSISPTTSSLANGYQLQYRVTGIYTDRSARELTGDALWSSSDDTIASISNGLTSGGLASSLAPGSVTISANLKGISATATLEVTEALLESIQIEPLVITLPAGKQHQFKALGEYSDNTQRDISSMVTWQSSAPAIATINTSGTFKGFASALIEGSTTISASLHDINGSAELAVSAAILESLTVSMSSTSIPDGLNQQAHAIGTYSDNSIQELTSEVTWSSADNAIALVSNSQYTKGQVLAISPGSTQINAQLGAITAGLAVTVIEATLVELSIDSSLQSMAKGSEQLLKVNSLYTDGSQKDVSHLVVWSSSDESKITVGNLTDFDKGVVTAIGEGNATVYADYKGKRASLDLSVTPATLSSLAITPASLSLPKGTTEQLSLIGTFSDDSTQDLTLQASWASDSSAATVGYLSDPGLLQAMNKGNAVITASFNGLSATADITVTDAVLTALEVTSSDTTLLQGYEMQMTATGTYSDSTNKDLTQAVLWSLDKPELATISNSGNKGTLSGTGITSGTAVISASLNGISASKDINLVYNDTTPVRIRLTATPNIILDDGVDASRLDFAVINSLNEPIPNQIVDVELSRAGTVLDTVSGSTGATGEEFTNFTYTETGIYQLKVTEQTTGISTSVSVTVATSLTDLIGVATQRTIIGDSNRVEAGTAFVFSIINFSNREFTLTSYEFVNGSTQIAFTDDTANLSGGDLKAGETLTITTRLEEAIDGPFDFRGTFILQDAKAGELSISRSFTVTTP